MQADKNLEERAVDDGGWRLPGAGWMKGAVDRLKGYGPAGGATCLRVVFIARGSDWVALRYART